MAELLTDLTTYLEQAVADQASDIFFIAGGPVSEKIEGRLRSMGDCRLLPPDTKRLISNLYTLADRSMDTFVESGDDDFSFSVPGLARFRVNAYKQRGSLAAVVRLVSFDIPAWQDRIKIFRPSRSKNLSDRRGRRSLQRVVQLTDKSEFIRR